ncbi:MAG: helix-turn-helix transcriptional regulator [Lachnospiraceae bacterium]|nr:helix-turn-helix transcriptional regulator [Lachnospiraceae bacterium]
MEQKVKQDSIQLGKNIRRIRKEQKIGQTELVALMQLKNVQITRETLVKIERGIQHIKATQLKAMKEILNTSYEEIFKEE